MGHGATPSANHLRKFNTKMHQLRHVPTSTEIQEIVLVHCTHGLNRTGYFICNYLITALGYHGQGAIDMFERARGHTMKYEKCKRALRGLVPLSRAMD